MLTPDDFAGTWTLDRQITDHIGPMSGGFQGQARWSPHPNGHIAYSETGTLRLAAGGQMKAERQYLWHWQDGQVAVFFQDGAPFHHFTPAGVTPGTTHLCGQDTYDVTYDFRDWPRWTATWRVTGPRKNYTSVGAYAPGPLA